MSRGQRQKLPVDLMETRVRKRVRKQMTQMKRRKKGRRLKPAQVLSLQEANGLQLQPPRLHL